MDFAEHVPKVSNTAAGLIKNSIHYHVHHQIKQKQPTTHSSIAFSKQCLSLSQPQDMEINS
jgi:hypothetical protein